MHEYMWAFAGFLVGALVATGYWMLWAWRSMQER
jgi:hypothetical protein